MDDRKGIVDDDMPPELEDLSEELNKIRVSKGKGGEETNGEIKVQVINDSNSLNKETSKTVLEKKVTSNPTTKEEDFGSFMKKGFFKRNLQSNNCPPSTHKKPEIIEDLTHIKSSTDTTPKTKLLEEFKQELNTKKDTQEGTSSLLNNIVNKKDEWMNQDLLTKFSQKPHLMKYFMDPRFSEVMALMQKDPQAALARYGHVKEFAEFMKEFSSIMADHFNNLSQQKMEKKASNDQNNFDQETQEILNDPKIAPIIFKLQTEGKLDIEEINKDSYISSRVKKLIDKGVFRVQTESEINSEKK